MTENYWTNLLFAGDLHKRHKDISTIEGYVKCTHAVQAQLERVIQDRHVDYFISLGACFSNRHAVELSATPD